MGRRFWRHCGPGGSHPLRSADCLPQGHPGVPDLVSAVYVRFTKVVARKYLGVKSIHAYKLDGWLKFDRH